jgi:hypothetical protein
MNYEGELPRQTIGGLGEIHFEKMEKEEAF